MIEQCSIPVNLVTAFTAASIPPPTITFCSSQGGEIMRLDGDGMTYKGQRIEDGGEAHRAFLEVMQIMREKLK